MDEGNWAFARLGDFVLGTSDAVLLVDDHGTVLASSARARELVPDPVGRNLVDDLLALPRDFLVADGGAEWRTVDLGNSRGAPLPARVRATPVAAADKAGWLITLRPLSEPRDAPRAEGALADTDGYAEIAVDTLCSRLGHQFANLLTPMMGYIELTRLDADPGSELAGLMESFMNISRRMIVHVQNLLMIRRRAAPVFHRVDLRDIAREAVKTARDTGLLGEHSVTVIEEVAAEPLPIDAESDLPQLLLVNLLLNAAESMPTRGTITVSLARRAEGIEVRIADTGTGVAPADRERVFEPFHTTKANGRAIGLGLYVCRIIARRHGGTLTLASAEAGGLEGGGAAGVMAAGEGGTVAIVQFPRAGSELDRRSGGARD